MLVSRVDSWRIAGGVHFCRRPLLSGGADSVGDRGAMRERSEGEPTLRVQAEIELQRC